MVALEDVFEVGPTHHLIGHLPGGQAIGAFELFPVEGSSDAIGNHRSLWAAESTAQKTLRLLPTHRAFVNERNDAQRKMWRTRSELHYARNMRWTSQALLAATTKNKTMGGRAGRL